MQMYEFKWQLKRFAEDEDATLSVEAIIIFPILLWAYIGMYVFWDAFKMQNINVKAAYTVSDMISREIVNITPDYVDGLSAMLRFLNKSKYDTRLRVSVVAGVANATDPTQVDFVLQWSQGRGGLVAHTSMEDLEPSIPIMAAGSEVIVVETEMDYIPLLPKPYGMDARTFTNTIVTRPRFIRGQMGFTATGT
jgi:hypothetical protein